MKYTVYVFFVLFCNGVFSQSTLPDGFQYINEEIPSIKMELKYATKENFTGTFVAGYYTNKGVVTTQTIQALKKVQKELKKQKLALIIYDAYRPQKAVNHFVKWAKATGDTLMKKEYYPNVAKKNLFKKGYIASHSRHSSGSTIDLSIISLKTNKPLDMGSPYDFFGEKSIYSLEMGYFFQNMNITIDKGCSGFNFWMMSFVLSAFILIQLFGKWWKKLSLILLSFCLTYLVTIVVNFSRIVIAIFLQKTPFSFLHGKQIHLLEGGMIYLTTLVLIYLFLTNYILPVYEKSIES